MKRDAAGNKKSSMVFRIWRKLSCRKEEERCKNKCACTCNLLLHLHIYGNMYLVSMQIKPVLICRQLWSAKETSQETELFCLCCTSEETAYCAGWHWVGDKDMCEMLGLCCASDKTACCAGWQWVGDKDPVKCSVCAGRHWVGDTDLHEMLCLCRTALSRWQRPAWNALSVQDGIEWVIKTCMKCSVCAGWHWVGDKDLREMLCLSRTALSGWYRHAWNALCRMALSGDTDLCRMALSVQDGTEWVVKTCVNCFLSVLC